jgi:hypothetical protein
MSNLNDLWEKTEKAYELELNDTLAMVYPVTNVDFDKQGWYTSFVGLGLFAETKRFDFKEGAIAYAEQVIIRE